MGKKTPSAPAAPDPVATANAQSATNKETALWNSVLGNINQVTPNGNLTYTQTPATSADQPPTWTATTTLSPAQQQILDNQNRADIGTSQLGADQVGRIADALAKPVDFSGLAAAPGSDDFSADSKRVADALYGQYSSRLDPQWQQEKTAFDQQMFAKGIMPGSDAYKTAYDDYSRSKNDAYSSAMNQSVAAGGAEQSRLFGLQSTAHQQAIQDYLTQREQPLNETTALLSGSQVSQPSFVNNANTPAAASPDLAGLTQNAYNAQYAGYQNAVNNNNATSGALFGLAGRLGGAYAGSTAGSAAISALFSDSRLKENITRIGTENGFPIYTFNYIEELDPKKEMYRGVMAQDVLELRPDAVEPLGDWLGVRYDKLGIEFRKVH